MREATSALSASLLLGALWSLWHLPVVNYLGTATPHGDYWLAYFFAFAFAMTAMRVLICWLYSNTRSVLAAQLLHVISTGSLVVFSATRVTAAEEAFWYAIYGSALWAVVAIVLALFGKGLRRRAA
jgi:hypothetical protein